MSDLVRLEVERPADPGELINLVQLCHLLHICIFHLNNLKYGQDT